MGKTSSLTAAVMVVGAAALMGCTFSPGPRASGDAGSGGGGGLGGRGGAGVLDAGPPPACQGLQCRKPTCTAGTCTEQPCAAGEISTISGTVYEPAGRTPLFNVSVYIPNGTPSDLPTGASCDRCTMPSGTPIAQTTTDVRGQFTLRDVPVGANIPLVIEVGKWRRQVTIDNVARCANTAIPGTDLTRLPRNQSEGHLPKIALTTGGADALECLLRKIGISDMEFTNPSGTGRVNLFNGAGGRNRYDANLNAGAMFTAAPDWWGSLENLRGYDMILHSCEGVAAFPNNSQNNKTAAAFQALHDYAGIGGRVFLSHWHNNWLYRGPAPWPTVAMFQNSDDLGSITATVDRTRQKGMDLASWLQNVGATTTLGLLPIMAAQHTVNSVNADPALVQRLIYYTNSNPDSVQYFSFDAPMEVPQAQRCGRVVFTDIHVTEMDVTPENMRPGAFPAGCVTTVAAAARRRAGAGSPSAGDRGGSRGRWRTRTAARGRRGSASPPSSRSGCRCRCAGRRRRESRRSGQAARARRRAQRSG